jgi:hypothetical protein
MGQWAGGQEELMVVMMSGKCTPAMGGEAMAGAGSC